MVTSQAELRLSQHAIPCLCQRLAQDVYNNNKRICLIKRPNPGKNSLGKCALSWESSFLALCRVVGHYRTHNESNIGRSESFAHGWKILGLKIVRDAHRQRPTVPLVFDSLMRFKIMLIGRWGTWPPWAQALCCNHRPGKPKMAVILPTPASDRSPFLCPSSWLSLSLSTDLTRTHRNRPVDLSDTTSCWGKNDLRVRMLSRPTPAASHHPFQLPARRHTWDKG